MLYQELLDLSYQKREVLVHSNVDELEKIIKQEETLLFQAAKFDRICKSMIRELAVMYGLTEQESTLAKVVQLADQEMLSDFKNIEQELSNVITKLAEVTALNTKLVEQGLLIVNYSLNLLAQSSVGPTYHPNENASFKPPNKALFDSKV